MVGAAPLWIVGAIAFYVYATVYEPAGDRPPFTLFGGDATESGTWPYPIDWVLWGSLSLVALAPIATHPLLLHRARHR